MKKFMFLICAAAAVLLVGCGKEDPLAAVRSALDNTGKVILQDHMRHCMVDAVAAGDTDAIDDLCQAIDKYMK